MKEYNEELNIDDVLKDQKGDDAFDKSTQFFSKYGKNSLEELERHAKINTGFHDYEEDSFADKQMIGNLCDLYKVFFEGNPQFNSFLKEMKEYAELDPYTHENYTKERLFVESIPAKLDALRELIEAEEEELQDEIRRIEETKFSEKNNDGKTPEQKKLLEKEKAEYDRKWLLRQEVLDNRSRALASFDMYFYNMAKGEMADLDELSDIEIKIPKVEEDKKADNKENNKEINIEEKVQEKVKDIIAKTNNEKGRGYAEFYNNKGVKCYYINSSGVELDLSIKGEGLNTVQKMLAGLANKSSSEIDIKNAPIFPHEPRMTDVSQHVSGECYLYAGLQNIARLYPQKIKEMIKDNGDGTATVRLWGKYKNPKTFEKEYRPVYVRVDKKISRFGAVGLEYERMAEDCLWVNLIERAYAMSGLHESELNDINLPLSPEEIKTKKWKPSVSGIEGGTENSFLEKMLGPDGESHSITIPNSGTIRDERLKVEKNMKAQEIIKDVNITNPESIAKHAFYRFYKDYVEKTGGELLSEKEFQNLSEGDVIKQVENLCTLFNVSDFLHLENAYKVIKKTAENVLKETEASGRSTMYINHKLGAAFENAVDEVLAKAEYDDNEADNAKSDFRKVYNHVRDGISEIGIAEDIPKREKTIEFYNTVKNLLDKGLPVSCSTYNNRKDMLSDERHAYSLIGAVETDGVPKRYFFRIKNPHTKLESTNGAEYRNENGEIVGKWVNVKDGIFDIELENFCYDFENLHYNGGEVLTNMTAKKMVGYDIISPEQIAENEKTTVTNDKLVDYMKAANDLYDALVCTNSKYSKDSQQYKDLLEGFKQFRHKLAGTNGKSIESLKSLTQPLMGLVKAYEDHVDGQILRPSKRQNRRKNVCSGIREVVSSIENGHNPHQEYEKKYAKTIMEKYYDIKGIDDKAAINEVAERLYNNKAFRGIANNTNIMIMKKPAKGQLERDIEKIENSLKGRGIDKRIDMATMRAIKDPLSLNAAEKNNPKKGAKKGSGKNDKKDTNKKEEVKKVVKK